MPGVALKVDARPLILHFVHHLVVGGMENGLVNLINHMSPTRYRHAVACIEDFSEFRNRIERKDVEVFALRRSKIGIWKLRRKIFELCRRLQPALVHTRNMSGLDALLPARLAGVKGCIHSEHGWDIDNVDGNNWKPRIIRRLHSPLVDHYITVSKELQNYLVEKVGISASRISQIYNGVDILKFSPAGDAPERWRPPAFRQDGQIIIGSVGRIQPIKDQSTLLRAFAQLLTDAPELGGRVKLVIVGNGPLLNDLRQLGTSLGVEPYIWLPGALDNIPDVIRSLDVFVLPSLNEGISNTILEAMACGVPVVATAVGGNPELVCDGVTGRLFKARDVTTLANLLREYTQSESLRRQHGREARNGAVSRHSLSVMVNHYEVVYDALRAMQN